MSVVRFDLQVQNYLTPKAAAIPCKWQNMGGSWVIFS